MAKSKIPERSPAETRDRFSWDGDEVLFLDIDGQNIQSTPPPKSEPEKPKRRRRPKSG